MKEVGFSYLEELNEVQRKAVTALEGPVMVIAGPGSGKTRVLTYRIAHLLNNHVPPYQILALTFTNKAARELKQRIEDTAGVNANKIWAGTFHSLFARILRVEAHRLGYPNDFTIYDTDDSKSLINEIIKTMGLDKKAYNTGAVRARISSAKSNLITPKMYAVNNDMQSYDRMNRRPMIFKIYEAYVKKCKRAGAMDFDDLLLQMFRLLYQNPDNIRAKYQQQFKYVLVDEFQDTNFLQYEIMKLLVMYENSPNNICIVGDDAQSIYSFRGATIENILQFTHDFPNTQTFKLEQNYRSTEHIVAAANEVINYNKKQIQKKIWTAKDGGSRIKIIKAMTDNEEGRRVADTIVEQKNRFHLSSNEIAILYRTNAQSRVFEEHLRRFNIPYKIYGGLSFYSRKEIKDMIAYMRLAVNEKDDEALKRVINYPRRGIGAGTIEKIRKLADDNELSMWECLSQIKFTARAANSVVQEWVEDDVLEEGEEATSKKGLAEFLQTISLMTDQDDSEKEQTEAVTLMSVHAAKGLEYKSVFVVGLEENLFPSYLSLSSPDQLDEERRLFYVAITRAEQYLTLTHSNSRYQFGQMRFNDPSRFLEEIPDDHVEASISRHREKDVIGTPKKLQGLFKPVAKAKALAMDPKDFKPNAMQDLKSGMRIIHLKFGEGTIKDIDDRNVATIYFDNLIENQEKRIMLQYAKLQIVE